MEGIVVEIQRLASEEQILEDLVLLLRITFGSWQYGRGMVVLVVYLELVHFGCDP